MLLKILGTIFSKIFNAGIGFLVVVITARALGASIRGDIALILLNISIVGLVQGIFNGSVLVYLTPKFAFLKLFLVANLFSSFLAIVLPYVMYVSYLIPNDQVNSIVVLTLIQGLLTTSQSLLLGKEKIHLFNLLEILKSSSLILSIIVLFWGMNDISLDAVIKGYLISYSIPFVISIISIIRYFNDSIDNSRVESSMIKSFLKYGFEIQINSILHMLNYRFCFYVIEKWKGESALGVFSIVISLCETVWIISKSISTYQYTKIVNTKDSVYQNKLTIQSFQLSFLMTLPALIVLLLLPSNVFTVIFGNDFNSIKSLLIYISTAILSLSLFTVINHYFSGIGKNKVNITASLIGNIVVIGSSLVFIPIWGNIGAAIATSLTSIVMLVYLIYRFLKQNDASFGELIPKISSVKSILNELKN